ncbi:RNA-binding protein 48-like [Oppia nitens]|uniref:RNA-binding protein 48-like n=1 Tax=Oppia nitens TaxID=1686743 RepID=UPI0023DBB579|nr:RNA-binding protein 48-like [Oppia nitens]
MDTDGHTGNSDDRVIKVEAYDHYNRQSVCTTRSRYRSGRRETAVKVMTICDESRYLLIHRVHDIKGDVKQELHRLCHRYGPIDSLNLTDYPKCEEFTKVYLIKYRRFVDAVRAKKSLDDRNFLGSVLHVCYAPELETLDETRDKLHQRLTYVSRMSSKKSEKQTTGQSIVTEDMDTTDDNINESVKQSNEDMIAKNRQNLKRKFDVIRDKFVADLKQTNTTAHQSTSEAKMKETPRIRWRK